MTSPTSTQARALPLALVLLAAAGTFALTMGARQSMGLFLGPLNTHTGLGLASMRRRAALLGATLSVGPGPQATGTEVRLEVGG